VRKIAAAAAAIPLFAYVFVSAALRRLFPGSSGDAGQSRRAGSPDTQLTRSNAARSGSIRTNASSLRGTMSGTGRSYGGDEPPTPMAVPVRSVGPDAAAGAFPVRPFKPELELDGKAQARMIDTTPLPEPADSYAFETRPRRDIGPAVLQVMGMSLAVSLLVAGLLLGLPVKQVAGGTPPSFVPIPPQADSGRSQGDLPLDVGYQVKFSKPMNEASVESAVSISPGVGLKFQWDAAAENVTLVPDPHWTPNTAYVANFSTTATDQQGLALASPMQYAFKSGSLTSGTLIATEVVDQLVSPGTAFQVTFTRPVKALMVQMHLTVALLATCAEPGGNPVLPIGGACPVTTPAASPSDSPSPSPSPSAGASASPSAGPVVPTCPAVGGVTAQPVNGVCPGQVPLDVVGDDPSDVTSQVFTATPNDQLLSNASYRVTFNVGQGGTAATDAVGAALLPVTPLQVTTMSAPGVLRFLPRDGTSTYDTNSPISVRFTAAMDTKSAAAAFTVTDDGAPVLGSKHWSEGNTVLTLSPRGSFGVGSTIKATVTSAARAAGGLHLAETVSATFTVSKRPAVKIGYSASPTKSSPWHGSEVYYMALMNCTRTGGWVTKSGACSSVTHHTLPAQGYVRLNADISNRVARPYAKYMADNRLLSHTLRGTNPHTRMCAAGYCGASWAENIASPSSAGTGGMIQIEVFYQNESWCRCEHYLTIMNPHFHQAGVGVWFSRSVRVAIDYYG
jgi:Bacterial Ig-like domain